MDTVLWSYFILSIELHFILFWSRNFNLCLLGGYQENSGENLMTCMPDLLCEHQIDPPSAYADMTCHLRGSHGHSY